MIVFPPNSLLHVISGTCTEEEPAVQVSLVLRGRTMLCEVITVQYIAQLGGVLYLLHYSFVKGFLLSAEHLVCSL